MRTLPQIPELDGVRGLAILLVLLCHLEPPVGVPKFIGSVLYLGWSGVDLFFVLSGFLITGILLDTRDAPNWLSSFYARRALRVFPLYLAVVLVSFRLILPWYGIRPQHVEFWYWIHLSNWKIAFGEYVPGLNHLWSLAVEEQFYLLWPAVLFITPRRYLAWVCVVVMATSLGLRIAFADQAYHRFFLYVLTPFRVEPLAAGALGACLVRDERVRNHLPHGVKYVFAFAALGLMSVLAIGKTNRPFQSPMATFGYTCFALIYSCLVLRASLFSGDRAVSALRGRLLRAFGKYSYAIYVFQMPIMIVCNTLVTRVATALPQPWMAMAWVMGAISEIGVCFLAGWLSWRLIEKHFLRWKDRFAPRQQPARMAMAA